MHRIDRRGLRALFAALAAAAVAAGCGGGGGNSGVCSGSAAVCGTAAAPAPAPAPAPAAGALPPAASVANVCTADGQKQFTRSFLNDYYLWYSEVPSVNAALHSSVPSYFYSLLTPQLDASGQPKDRFSFVVPYADADSLLTGQNVGYGVEWRTDEQGRTRVAYVHAGSPAALAGLQRGGVLVSTATANPNWFPNAQASITFTYRATPVALPATITLTTAAVQEDPVPQVQTLTTGGGRKVGYVLFNAFTEGAQDKLIPALTAARAAGVQDVVLDLRYNGGGYLYTALSLASMIAPPAQDGRIFEQLRYNDKRQAETQESTLYLGGTVAYGESAIPTGAPLPRLALPRVYVLATGNTCSASESVINGLRGVGVNVVTIGGTTCGKPYGFSRADNCGWSYFAIEFQGVNAAGFGDYANGFTPTCAANDDFDDPLGSPSERLLATALYHVDNGTCPSQPLASAARAATLPQPFMQGALRGKLLPARR